MSYYTTIYPEGEFDNTPLEELDDEIEKSKTITQSCWEDIVAMCAASPTDPKEAVQQFKSDLTKYIEFYKVYCRECLQSQYLRSLNYYSEEEKKTAKKSLDWNHFEHNSDPEGGIEDEQKAINYVRDKLVMMCAASPEKIYSNTTEEGNFVNPLDWMYQELNNLKEYLDEAIYTKMFCELCIKYWDTHTEG